MDEGIINKEGRMVEERVKHNAKIANHANGAVQFLGSLIGGRYVTKEQVREAMNFFLASKKRNIESYPNTIPTGKGC